MGAVDNSTSLPLSPSVPPSRTSLNYLDLPAGHIQIFTTLPQGLWQISGVGTGLSSVLVYHGECGSPALKLPASPSSLTPDFVLSPLQTLAIVT